MEARARSFRRRALAGLVVVVLGALASTARAQASEKNDAAAAYDVGAAAYDRGDFVVAATELARADELAPNPVTLELAIGAVLRTNDAGLGMALVERAEKRKGAKALDKAADAARRRFASKVGKLNVMCLVTVPCEVTVDGDRFEPGTPHFVAVGSRDVSVKRGGVRERFSVLIEPGKTIELVPVAPLATSQAPSTKRLDEGSERTAAASTQDRDATSSRGVSPTWFWIGVGVTAAVGGVATASAFDTRAKYDVFAADRSNAEASDAGRSAERRTIALIAGAGVAAIATAAVGLFVVDWKSPSTRSGAGAKATAFAALRVRLAVAPTGAAVGATF